MDNTLRSLIENEYKINISDEDYKRLQHAMANYNVSPASCRIDLQSDYHSFVNNIHLIRDIKFMKNHTHIELEDVIYQMRPVEYGVSEAINVSYPKKINQNTDHISDATDEVPYDNNIVIIRSMYYDARDIINMKEKFTLMIYNKALDIRSGIMFEKIE